MTGFDVSWGIIPPHNLKPESTLFQFFLLNRGSSSKLSIEESLILPVDAAPTKEEKEKKEDGVFYVDMSMPTYDNSSGGKKKSAFAL